MVVTAVAVVAVVAVVDVDRVKLIAPPSDTTLLPTRCCCCCCCGAPGTAAVAAIPARACTAAPNPLLLALLVRALLVVPARRQAELELRLPADMTELQLLLQLSHPLLSAPEEWWGCLSRKLRGVGGIGGISGLACGSCSPDTRWGCLSRKLRATRRH